MGYKYPWVWTQARATLAFHIICPPMMVINHTVRNLLQSFNISQVSRSQLKSPSLLKPISPIDVCPGQDSPIDIMTYTCLNQCIMARAISNLG